MMQNKTACLAKFGSKEHMEALQNHGVIYMNTWKHFRDMEEDNGLRGDELEGVLSLFQGPQVRLFMATPNEQNIEIGPLVNQFKVSGQPDLSNIFCLYSFSEYSLNDLNSKRLLEFGGYCALITRPDIFLQKVEDALSTKGYSSQSGFVNYHDITVHNGSFGPFAKSDNYSFQKEFRIITKTNLRAPLILNLGDLKDVVFVCPTEELHGRIRILTS